ncbi:MAG: hypothetical protein V1660_03610 [archaeon]
MNGKLIAVFVISFLIVSNLVSAISKEDALPLLEKANQSVMEMRNAGLTTHYANDLLNEAYSYFEEGDYESVSELTQQIADSKNRAIVITDFINKTKQKIAESKYLQKDEFSEEIAAGQNALDENRYEDAENTIQNIYQKINEIESQPFLIKSIRKTQIREKAIYILKKYWYILIPAFIAAIIILSLIGRIASSIILKVKIRNLKKEKETIISLIKEAQQDYFETNSMSKERYTQSIERYQQRIIEIEELLPLMQEKYRKISEKEKNGDKKGNRK